MLTSRQILQTLCDGQYHSGEKLASQFGVSRTAVWKHFEQLRQSGLTIISSRGKGYRLHDRIELLDRDIILSLLDPATSALMSRFQLEFSVGSTNALAMTGLNDGTAVGRGTVIVAEQQLAGRGRRGREWVSPLGHNIYFSLGWRFVSGVSALQGLSLAIGVIMAELLDALGFADVSLKWPNDLVWRGRKLGGILVEMTGDADGPCAVVAGVGLNVTMSSASDANVDQPWVDLLEIGGGGHQSRPEAGAHAPVKNRVVAAMMNRLLPAFADFESSGFADYIARWQSRDCLLGCDVVLSMGSERVIGHYLGVNTDGSIAIKTATGMKVFSGGEVSLRAHADS